MLAGDKNKPFQVGTWLVQPDLNRLSDGDQIVNLELRVMGVLVCLASRPGKIVSADELLNTVWHGRTHADDTIYQAIAQLRKALGEDIHHPRFIETIPKRGYRLICPVVPVVLDNELHATSGTGFGLRFFALTAGIVLIAVASTLMVNPEFRERLMPSVDTPRDKSVAVLPFVDMSEDGSQQYLGDGITEELIHVLSNLPGLRVIARTSSFAFRDSNEDIRQIGSKLNVATILEGSIRKDGDRIRVTSQLVDARNGYHLWSQTFDRRTTDLFKIQDEIAAAVATTFEYQALDALAIDDHAARTVELQTYELYLLGLHHLRRQSESGYMRATEYFERAIEKDPSFARAYAGLSESYAKQSWNDDPDLLRKAESAAEYALRLDDQSAAAYVVLGRTKLMKRDHSGAEAAFVKAIELNPNDVRAYSWLAVNYGREDRVDEAFVILQKALQLNPMSGELNTTMGRLQYVRSGWDWDSAFKYFERAMQRDPDYSGSYNTVGLYYYLTGQLNRAIPYIRKLIDLKDRPITNVGASHVALAKIYVLIGDFDSAANLIREMREIESDHLGATKVEIHLQLARRNFSAARGLVHSMLSTNIGEDQAMSLLAFYEMVIGDTDHAEEIYTHLAAAPASLDIQGDSFDDGDTNLYRGRELAWGMLGAVNLAYLHNSNGDTGAARELLVKAREYIESKSYYPWSDHPWYVGDRYGGGSLYVLAQIAAVEGNNDAAIEYFRKAVNAGWTKAWFGRIDPIMADLRKDARYIKMLDELENKLLKMREHPKMLPSNEP